MRGVGQVVPTNVWLGKGTEVNWKTLCVSDHRDSIYAMSWKQLGGMELMFPDTVRKRERGGRKLNSNTVFGKREVGKEFPFTIYQKISAL